MDIRMPVMDGYEATDILRNNPETAGVTIIALTASVMEEEIKRIKTRGFNHFLQKPIKYAELTEALAMFLNHDKEIPKSLPVETRQKLEISLNAREHINEIVEQLENNMTKKWEKVKSGGFIDEIATFGNQIKSMGQEYAFESLVAYGHKLIESTESFDVNTMKKTLNAFPGLIESVKKIASNQEENE
jgi:two-component system sensor histidine kinase EvgS